MSFNGSIVTVGTGYGSLLFYDIRVNKLLRRIDGSVCQLKSGKGWLVSSLLYESQLSKNTSLRVIGTLTEPRKFFAFFDRIASCRSLFTRVFKIFKWIIFFIAQIKIVLL